MIRNKINLRALEKTRNKITQGEFPEKKDFLVEGQWLVINGPGQFQATLEYPQGKVDLVTDQPPPSGGEGTAPNPVQYCVFAMLACYATTFMTLAAQKGVAIHRLKVRGASRVNMKAVFEIEEGPIVEKVWVALDIVSDAPPEVLEEIRALADQKCPAAFTVQNAVPFESRFV